MEIGEREERRGGENKLNFYYLKCWQGGRLVFIRYLVTTGVGGAEERVQLLYLGGWGIWGEGRREALTMSSNIPIYTSASSQKTDPISLDH